MARTVFENIQTAVFKLFDLDHKKKNNISISISGRIILGISMNNNSLIYRFFLLINNELSLNIMLDNCLRKMSCISMQRKYELVDLSRVNSSLKSVGRFVFSSYLN